MSMFSAGGPAAAAFDAFLPSAAQRSAAHQAWRPADGPMPAIFLSHGAPPVFDDARWMTEFFEWAQSMPKPRAILVVSAHWEHAPLSLSGTQRDTPLVYDFGGFDRRYYEMTYPTPDAAEFAQLVLGSLPDRTELHEYRNRGLDHGAWVPLKVMYPNADVPVLQLSIPTHDPDSLIALGARLKPLREHGVLVVGSGFMTHGRPTRDDMLAGRASSWNADFDAWAADALRRGDVNELADYRAKAPGLALAHPTVEHLVPLFVTLGAATDPQTPVQMAIEGTVWANSKRSFQVA